MVKRPKVSIIIPIYNVEDYLSRCLESVMNQTLSDIEIIGVNDGTKDNSVEIMREYMALDSRMQLVEKENGGLSSARNAGLAVATGDMILFLDSDDYFALNACERIYEERLNHGADIIVFGSTPFPEVPECGLSLAGMFIIRNFIRMLYSKNRAETPLHGTEHSQESF